MKIKKKHTNTSDVLEKLAIEHTTENREDVITLDELKNSLHERGFGLILAVICLPVSLPIPVPPGYTTIFSIPLFFVLVQMIMGLNSPWLPKWLGQKKIKKTFLKAIISKSVPYFRWIEKFLHPRLTNISTRYWEKFIGFSGFILAVDIFLPIPIPLSNFFPGIGILIMAVGLMGRDGVMILIGFAIGCFGLIYTVVALILGYELLMKMINFF
jgi:hypothetical protein